MERPKLNLLLVLATATLFLSISLAISTSDQPNNQTTSILSTNSNPTQTSTPAPRSRSLRSKATTSAAPRHQPNHHHNHQSQQQQQEPLAYLQEQVRIMAGYNNTPPVFATATRDFFVDVGRQPLGTRIATIRAIDLEGDQLEYSLKKAIYRDASSYFTINSTTGELRLANKQFKYYLPAPMTNTSLDNADKDYDEKDGDADDDDDYDTFTSPEDDSRISASNYLRKNLYYLTVSADDGHQANNIEIQIHVINSSSIQTFGNLPVQLAPTDEINKNMLNILRTKTNEYYDKLNNITAIRRNNNSDTVNPTVVYPNYMNPGIIIPNEEQPPSQNYNSNRDFVRQLEAPLPAVVVSQTTTQSPSNVVKTMTQLVPNPLLQEHNSNQKFQDSLSPQIVVTLVVTCSILIIALVLLMFIVPLSVKRLRKRLKHVELQHEHLSQQTSNGSFVCSSHPSSSVGSTSGTFGTTHHNHHNSSLSQFTQCSSNQLSCPLRSRSSVCRQSSLDSSTTTVLSSTLNPNSMIINSRGVFNDSHTHKSSYNNQQQQSLLINSYQNQHNKYLNNGSIITNPVYLQEHNNHLLQTHQQFFPSQIMQTRSYQINHHQQQQQPLEQISQALKAHELGNSSNDNNPVGSCYNVYYPIDDEVYSTIQTSDTITGIDSNNIQTQNKQQPIIHNYFTNQQPTTTNLQQGQAFALTKESKQQNELRRADSPNDSESGSSTRSLARFLSLPARHSIHNGNNNNKNKNPLSDSSDEFFGQLNWNKSNPTNNNTNEQQNYLVGAKTIARASRVDREQCNQLNNDNNKRHNWEIERHRIRFINMLDKGQFGLVWRCTLRKDNQNEQTVAVKMLNSGASKNERDRQELLAEIDIMKLVSHHPNVVKLLYCCTIDSNIETRPILLIMEYVELGKLQKYLENSRKNHYYATTITTTIMNNNNNDDINHNDNSYSFDGDNNSMIQTNYHVTSRDLIKFIYHVAKGMEYLASKCIVHRDLASRNILVSVDKICKIGDFGMARHMQSLSGVYERHSRNTKIPVRWMAPEVLLNNRFTIESDVYSLGILMWEIVTLGSTPYSNLKTEQVIEEVARKGQRPEKPEYCHQNLYKIMSDCWLDEPNCRPTFKSLVKQLDDLLLSADDYIELDQYPDHNYYNMRQALVPNELL